MRGIGRRGAYLCIHGALAMTYGVGLITVAANRPPEQRAIYALIADIASLRLWGWLWVATGLLAITAGVTRQLRAVAFSGLMGLATLWAIGFAAVDFLPGQPPNGAWIAGVLFATLMAGHAVVAGWPEVKP